MNARPLPGRTIFLSLALVLALAGCRDEGRELRVAHRIRLPGAVAGDATLQIDSAGLAWIGERGSLAAVDSTGRIVAQHRVAGRTQRLLWRSGDTLVVRSSAGGLRLLEAGTGRELAERRESRVRPLARDPRGRWVYATIAGAGVLGLQAATLRPQWGWPEVGAGATALAVSPAGDRVYLAVDADPGADLPPRVQARDEQTGRVLAELEEPRPVAELVAGPTGELYAVSEREVVALRHGPEGLARAWSTGLDGLGMRAPVLLRVSPAGDRLAVFSRGEGGRLRVLDARTGRELAGMSEAPADAAWDAAGRLWLLVGAELRRVR